MPLVVTTRKGETTSGCHHNIAKANEDVGGPRLAGERITGCHRAGKRDDCKGQAIFNYLAYLAEPQTVASFILCVSAPLRGTLHALRHDLDSFGSIIQHPEPLQAARDATPE